MLVPAQLFNAFNSRSDRVAAFRGVFSNPRLFAAVGLSLDLQVLVVHVPFLNEAFGTVALSPIEWLGCAAMASSVLRADEARMLLVRHWPRRAAAAAARFDATLTARPGGMVGAFALPITPLPLVWATVRVIARGTGPSEVQSRRGRERPRYEAGRRA